MYQATRANIDMQALMDNYNLIRAHIDSSDKNTRIICVVKADAYGHGAARCAEIYRALGARDFAVSSLDEAVEIRRTIGDDGMILILGYTDPAYAAELRRYNITQTVYSLAYAKALSDNLDGELPVHIKVDTGMNRLGFRADESGVDEVLSALRLKNLVPDGIFTHFATADEPDDSGTRAQYALFIDFIERLKDSGYSFRMRHCCNSAACIRFPEMYLDAVRCGIILYGLNPSEHVRLPGLKPVMSLHSRVVHIHNVAPGDKISYGGTFSSQRHMRVATIPIGYADGFLRAYASQGVYIDGKFAKILGRICMDQCIADVTDIPCRENDPVEIFGAHQSVDVFARAGGTINYEVTCMVGKRVPRDEV